MRDTHRIETPKIVETASQLTANIHVIVTWEEIQNVMGPTLQELIAEVQKQGLEITGPWFTHHFRRPTDTFDFDVCIPVSAPISPAGRVKPDEWPAMKVARTVYQGPYEGLAEAWGEFCEWLETSENLPQDHTTAQDLWERYLTGPESSDDPTSWRTELNRPLVDRT